MLGVVSHSNFEDDLVHSKRYDKQQVHQHCCDEDDEQSMIFKANAVIDPVTMMVKSFYALTTTVAVFRPLSHDNFAFSTNFPEVYVFNDILQE